VARAVSSHNLRKYGRQLTNFKTDRIRSFRWSPDGKSSGVLCERVEGDVVLLREASAKN